LFLVLAMIAGGFATTYLMVLRGLRRLVHDNQLKVANRLGALDEAIQALETRLAEHHAAETRAVQEIAVGVADDQESAAEAGEPAVDPEVKAAIAAAAMAALGQNAVVKAIKPVSSPWSQQGRVLVQGSHNLRVRQ
jgi:hypothetical protein